MSARTQQPRRPLARRIRLTPGGGRWKLNLAPGEPVRIRLRGRDIHAVPEIVSDIDEVERLLRLMAASSQMVKRFVAIPQDPDGRFDRERLKIAIAHGFRVIRWHPETTSQPPAPSIRPWGLTEMTDQAGQALQLGLIDA